MNLEKCSKHSLAPRLPVLAASALLVTGCAIFALEPDGIWDRYELKEDFARSHTLIREDMHKMWASLKRIEFANSDTASEEQTRQTAILEELDNLRVTAQVLNVEDSIYNYKFRIPYMDSFIHDVEMATEFAKQTPPDFDPAVNLVYSCQFCHVNN